MVVKGLSEKGKAILPFLMGAVNKGLSANSIIKMAQDLGISYRRQTMLDDIRILKGVEKIWEPLKYVPKDAKISEKNLVPSSKPMLTKYQFKVKADIYRHDLRERRSVYLTVSSDTLMSPNEIKRKLIDYIETWSPYVELEESWVVGGYLWEE